MAKSKHNARETAARVLAQVIAQHRSLTSVLQAGLPYVPDAERALCQQFCYGVLREYHQLDAIGQQLLRKPLKKKDSDIAALLLVGIYQLKSMRIPAHAAVSETVNATHMLGKPWAKRVMNACLRQFQRQQRVLEQQVSDETYQFSHPRWLLEQIKADWPEHWRAILDANNQQAPMILRVNTQRLTREIYLEKLQQVKIGAAALPQCPDALMLDTPQDVNQLPGFIEGEVSVQDGAAQRVIDLMQITPGLRILDACAAPGGKTCHMLEKEPDNDVVALDIDVARLEQIRQNLDRLKLNATLMAANAADTAAWWDGQLFDRILIDAPCSGTGVIRRHPDIKVLRQPEDIAELARQQAYLLDHLWPLLKPDGIMVYTTCSVLKQENEAQIAAFLHSHPDARKSTLTQIPGRRQTYGFQRFPGENECDGFYYASLCHR